MADAKIQELIDLLKTDPQAAFDKMGVPRLTPEQEAAVNREYAGLSYEEIRARVAANVEKGTAALGKEEAKSNSVGS